MRRLLFIKPPTGWADFITEIVIVVLGVFLALGAQETVNAWKERNELTEFQSAVDQEIAENLAAYEMRVKQSDCAKDRLDQLDAWQRAWRDGAGPAMLGRIRRPIGYTTSQYVWESGSTSNLKEMPLDQRLSYAAIYANFQTYENLRLREAAAWQSIYGYDQAVSLSGPEVNQLRGLILTVRALSWSIDTNWPALKQLAAKLRIAPGPSDLDSSARAICEVIAFSSAFPPAPPAAPRKPAVPKVDG